MNLNDGVYKPIMNNIEFKLMQFEDMHQAQYEINAYINQKNLEGKKILEMEEEVYILNNVRYYEYRITVEKYSLEERIRAVDRDILEGVKGQFKTKQ